MRYELSDYEWTAIADWIRELVRQQSAWANIPPKRNRKDPNLLQPVSILRAQLDRTVSSTRSKQCRRVATHDMTSSQGVNYLALRFKLASIRIWLLPMSPRPRCAPSRMAARPSPVS